MYLPPTLRRSALETQLFIRKESRDPGLSALDLRQFGTRILEVRTAVPLRATRLLPAAFSIRSPARSNARSLRSRLPQQAPPSSAIGHLRPTRRAQDAAARPRRRRLGRGPAHARPRFGSAASPSATLRGADISRTRAPPRQNAWSPIAPRRPTTPRLRGRGAALRPSGPCRGHPTRRQGRWPRRRPPGGSRRSGVQPSTIDRVIADACGDEAGLGHRCARQGSLRVLDALTLPLPHRQRNHRHRVIA